MLVQPPPVRIKQASAGRNDTDQREKSSAFRGRDFLKRFFQARFPGSPPSPNGTKPVDTEQRESQQKTAVHIHPKEHHYREEPQFSALEVLAAKAVLLGRIQNPEPDQSKQPTQYVRPNKKMNG